MGGKTGVKRGAALQLAKAMKGFGGAAWVGKRDCNARLDCGVVTVLLGRQKGDGGGAGRTCAGTGGCGGGIGGPRPCPSS